MKKLVQIVSIVSILFYLAGCSNNDIWSDHAASGTAISKQDCIGVASYLGQPVFINAQLKSSANSHGKKDLPRYWHELPNYHLDRTLIDSISHALKSQGMSCVVPLYRSNTKQEINQFLTQSIKRHHLQYVVLVNQGSTFEKEHSDVIFLLRGYGIFYTYRQGVLHNKPITKLYASLNVDLLNQQLNRVRTMSVHESRDVGESLWQSQFDQLDPRDVQSLVAWLNQAVVSETSFRAMNLLHLNIGGDQSAIH